MRAFLAVEIPQEIREKIKNIIEEFKRITNRNNINKVKWVKPENIHITIYFFGELNEKDVLYTIKELSSIEDIISPFEVSIKGISAFPRPEYPKVIWCGIEDKSDSLKKANHFVKDLINNNRLNVEIDNKEYSPHLTIGRVKSKYSKSLVEKINSLEKASFGKFIVNELILFSSTLTKSGPIYKEIKKFSFRGL